MHTAAPGISEETISARIERLPFSPWHVRMMAIAGLAHFSDAFDALAIAFVLPVLVSLWDVSPAEVGFLISAGYAGQMVGAMAFGWLAERIGRRSALQWTVIVIAALSLACGFAWNYLSFFVFRSVQGLGLGGEVPVAATYINEIAVARFRGRIVLLLQSTFAFGIVITAFASAWIVPHLGWQWMFFIGALPMLLGIWLRQLMPESPRWLATHGRLEEADAALKTVEEEIVRKDGNALGALPTTFPALVEEKITIGSLFQGRYFVRTVMVWSVMLCTSIVGYSLLIWMPTIYHTVLKLPVEQTLQFGVILSIASFLGGLSAAFLVDAIGRRSTFMLGFFGSAVALGLLWKIDLQAYPLHIVALAAVGLYFISMLLSGLYLYVPEIYPTRMRALGAGTGSAWLRAGSIIGPSLVGWILSVGDLSTAFLMFAIVAAVGGVLIFLFAVETRGRVLEEVAP
jgi:MFS transporter, putative metabolite:H+ symporter